MGLGSLWVGREGISPSGAKKAIQSSFPPPGGGGKPFSVQRPQSGFRPRSAHRRHRVLQGAVKDSVKRGVHVRLAAQLMDFAEQALGPLGRLDILGQGLKADLLKFIPEGFGLPGRLGGGRDGALGLAGP